MTKDMSENAIPLVDLSAQYHAHRDELDAALAACVERSSFIGGPDHAAFAEEFAAWCGGGHVALVGNGTDALALALIEILGPGDGSGEIITPTNTFIGTAEAIGHAGYRPHFVDIDPDTHLIDPAAAAGAVNQMTRALLPVHLYGQMADMDALGMLAEANNLAIIEDAAQAHGAKWNGKGPGQWGDAACFSFYPGKNLGAWGDGGAVYSRDEDVVARIGMRANHGRKDKYFHLFEGVNSRLDGLQAAILRVKLRHMDEWNAARRERAAWYDELLGNCEAVSRPVIREDAQSVFHLYVVEVDERDAVLEKLNKLGIGAAVHYPVTLHTQPAYAYLGYGADDLAVASRAATRILSLPLFPELTRDQAGRVAEELIKAVSP